MRFARALARRHNSGPFTRRGPGGMVLSSPAHCHGVARLSGAGSQLWQQLMPLRTMASMSCASPMPEGRSFFIETYGCQMNSSDSEVVSAILLKAGHVQATGIEDADIIMVNTCAIRENAEAKIWHRLAFFNSMRKTRKKTREGPLVGVLGCMAERLKDRLLEEEAVDFVCGPDAYRDVPRLVEKLASTGQKEANTVLSIAETYADISPVREAGSCSAFVSIMRGCNNMCSFCIVPFTRGRERSREMGSILSEIRNVDLHDIKEVCLLGQNVNGYHDASSQSSLAFPNSTEYKSTPGFSNLYVSKKKDAPGARFVDLLQTVSDISPELRVRFTSPHPKDFPDEVLHLIASRPNLCSSLHLPVQSGSTSCLSRMRRGYDREAYLSLFERAKDIIPGVTISTDIITGFSGETEAEHEDTLSLVAQCSFDQAFMFAYSEREKTHASRSLPDDVPEATKQRRLQEIIDVFRSRLQAKNQREEAGQMRLVLCEGLSTRSTPDVVTLTGRTDGNKRVVFPLPSRLLQGMHHVPGIAQALGEHHRKAILTVAKGVHMLSAAALVESLCVHLPEEGQQVVGPSQQELVGRYILVHIAEANGPTLRGAAVALTTNQEWWQWSTLLTANSSAFPQPN